MRGPLHFGCSSCVKEDQVPECCLCNWNGKSYHPLEVLNVQLQRLSYFDTVDGPGMPIFQGIIGTKVLPGSQVSLSVSWWWWWWLYVWLTAHPGDDIDRMPFLLVFGRFWLHYPLVGRLEELFWPNLEEFHAIALLKYCRRMIALLVWCVLSMYFFTFTFN
jgi:hypothetical protein